MNNPYVPLLWMMAIAAVMALGGVGASAILGPKRYNRAKARGLRVRHPAHPHAVGGGRFPVKYYLVAMTFIIFDIEVVFLYPWAVTFTEARHVRAGRDARLPRPDHGAVRLRVAAGRVRVGLTPAPAGTRGMRTTTRLNENGGLRWVWRRAHPRGSC